MRDLHEHDYLSVELERQDDTVVARFAGELDHSSSRWAFATIVGAFDRPPAQSLRLDLERVTFCDAGGVHLLGALERCARARGGAIALGALAPCVERVLEICTTVDGAVVGAPPCRARAVSASAWRPAARSTR